MSRLNCRRRPRRRPDARPPRCSPRRSRPKAGRGTPRPRRPRPRRSRRSGSPRQAPAPRRSARAGSRNPATWRAEGRGAERDLAVGAVGDKVDAGKVADGVAGEVAGDLLHAVLVGVEQHRLRAGREAVEQVLQVGDVGLDEDELGRRGLGGCDGARDRLPKVGIVARWDDGGRWADGGRWGEGVGRGGASNADQRRWAVLGQRIEISRPCPASMPRHGNSIPYHGAKGQRYAQPLKFPPAQPAVIIMVTPSNFR